MLANVNIYIQIYAIKAVAIVFARLNRLVIHKCQPNVHVNKIKLTALLLSYLKNTEFEFFPLCSFISYFYTQFSYNFVL